MRPAGGEDAALEEAPRCMKRVEPVTRTATVIGVRMPDASRAERARARERVCTCTYTRHGHSGVCCCLLHACSSRCQACNEHVGTSSASAGRMPDAAPGSGSAATARTAGAGGKRPLCDIESGWKASGRRTGRKKADLRHEKVLMASQNISDRLGGDSSVFGRFLARIRCVLSRIRCVLSVDPPQNSVRIARGNSVRIARGEIRCVLQRKFGAHCSCLL